MGTKLDWLLAWDFSGCSMDGNLMPTGTLDDCHLIDIKYDVIIKVKRSVVTGLSILAAFAPIASLHGWLSLGRNMIILQIRQS